MELRQQIALLTEENRLLMVIAEAARAFVDTEGLPRITEHRRLIELLSDGAWVPYSDKEDLKKAIRAQALKNIGYTPKAVSHEAN